MPPARCTENISVDFSKVRLSAAQALRQYAQRHHVKGRWLLADALGVQVQTADGYLGGRDPIPAHHLLRLPEILGFDFTSLLFDALERNGEQAELKRILHAHLQDIARDTYGNASHRRSSSLACSVERGGGVGRLGLV